MTCTVSTLYFATQIRFLGRELSLIADYIGVC